MRQSGSAIDHSHGAKMLKIEQQILSCSHATAAALYAQTEGLCETGNQLFFLFVHFLLRNLVRVENKCPKEITMSVIGCCSSVPPSVRGHLRKAEPL